MLKLAARNILRARVRSTLTLIGFAGGESLWVSHWPASVQTWSSSWTHRWPPAASSGASNRLFRCLRSFPVGIARAHPRIGPDRCLHRGVVPVLRNVFLEAQGGQSCSIMGPSGCGKSTLLNLIGCLDQPDSGRIEIPGKPIATWKSLSRLRRDVMLEEMGIGYLAEATPVTLSDGERQRAALAHALVHRPPILLADEPTGSVDSQTAKLILAAILDRCRQ